MNGQLIKNLIDVFKLIFIIMFVTHFFACLWIWIGMYYQYNEAAGWIQKAQKDDKILGMLFSDIYTASLYWIITSFTSVGYGDIFGDEPVENLFQMLVEMVGICFFGYMIGSIQGMIRDMSGQDFQSQ